MRDHPKPTQLHLGQKQLAIFKALLALRGTIVSRKTLYFAAWERDAASSRALDMQVHEIRTALGHVDPRLAGDSVIRSVYGAGYAID